MLKCSNAGGFALGVELHRILNRQWLGISTIKPIFIVQANEYLLIIQNRMYISAHVIVI